jgi:hypothetical protein
VRVNQTVSWATEAQAETRPVSADGRDADAYVSTRAPLPNWARVLARVSLSLTEHPLVVRISAGS